MKTYFGLALTLVVSAAASACGLGDIARSAKRSSDDPTVTAEPTAAQKETTLLDRLSDALQKALVDEQKVDPVKAAALVNGGRLAAGISLQAATNEAVAGAFAGGALGAAAKEGLATAAKTIATISARTAMSGVTPTEADDVPGTVLKAMFASAASGFDAAAIGGIASDTTSALITAVPPPTEDAARFLRLVLTAGGGMLAELPETARAQFATGLARGGFATQAIGTAQASLVATTLIGATAEVAKGLTVNGLAHAGSQWVIAAAGAGDVVDELAAVLGGTGSMFGGAALDTMAKVFAEAPVGAQTGDWAGGLLTGASRGTSKLAESERPNLGKLALTALGPKPQATTLEKVGLRLANEPDTLSNIVDAYAGASGKGNVDLVAGGLLGGIPASHPSRAAATSKISEAAKRAKKSKPGSLDPELPELPGQPPSSLEDAVCDNAEDLLPCGLAADACKAALKAAKERFLNEKDDSCPNLNSLVDKRCSGHKGKVACVEGPGFITAIVKSILEGEGMQCAIVKAAFNGWMATQEVQGITYPGGYCLECSGRGSSLNENDVYWTVFSRDVCGEDKPNYDPGDEEPPLPDLPDLPALGCNASFYGLNPQLVSAYSIDVTQSACGGFPGIYWLDPQTSPTCKVPGIEGWCVYFGTNEFCKLHGPDVIYDPMLSRCRWKKPTEP